jgi:3-oxoacyl-[acyl-carrier protein] reductase
VTGAGSGMGRATAELFAAEGARVAAIDVGGLTRVVDGIEAEGGVAAGFWCDVGDRASVDVTVAAVAERFGGIDIVVNNAGISVPVTLEDDAWEDGWARALAVNLTGEARVIRAALPWLKRSDAARVVNIASTEGLGATPHMSPYTASKHGVVGLTRSLAVSLGRSGITVNCICPGPILTGMTAPIPDEARDRFARRRVPAGRYGDPEEVAQMTLSLCLPAASYCNGAVLVVDGGMLAQNT